MSRKSYSYTFRNEGNDKSTKNGVQNVAYESTEPKLTDFVIEAHRGQQERSKISTNCWDVDDHRIPLDDVLSRYESDSKLGLRPEVIKKNQLKYGHNVLFPPKKSSELWKFLKCCLFGLNLLFWICAIISIACFCAQFLYTDDIQWDNLWSGIVLFIIVFITGCFSYYQEFKSGKVLDSFKKMIPTFAVVTRCGERMEINVIELAVGDIVEIKYGDRIPADIRVFECDSLKVDNSPLTGESDPQKRGTVCTSNNPMETANIVFCSTNVIEGSAKGIVIRVGEETFMGHLASLATSLSSVDTPIAREMKRLMIIMTACSLLFGLVFLGIGFSLRYSWIDSVFFAIGIIIANVPESLNVTLTIILSVTAKKMADKNCLVKQLQAVETLGSASVICSDKTGTLTQNKMSVAHMWFNDEIANADTSEYMETGYGFDAEDPGFLQLSKVAILCSRAIFMPDQDDIPILKKEVEGDSSEAAILKCMEMQVGNVENIRKEFPKVCEIPFNSRNKFQVSIHETNDQFDTRYLLVMKGAPEKIVDMCTTILVADIEYELTDHWRQRINDAYANFGTLGERVLGFCDCRLSAQKFLKGRSQFDPDNPDFLTAGFRFVGLISMIDPPRASVPDAVRQVARTVGIISEDSKTIQEISLEKNVDICDLEPQLAQAAVITGARLDELGSEELEKLLLSHEEIVFARTNPENKYRIVSAFQALGFVVAVTGDGVNDAPALKRADIGIAMGMTGTDVAKEVADMILLDDNFATLVSGVKDGRLIFDNLRKLFRFVMADNVAEMYCYCIFIILRIPLPMGTIPMILTTSFVDIFSAVSLAYETSEADIMKLKPRNQNIDTLITKAGLSYAYGQVGIIQTCTGFFTYFVIYAYYGWFPSQLLFIQRQWDSDAVQDLVDSYGQEWTYGARKNLEIVAQTGFFVALVIMQIVNVIACKTRRLSIFQKKMKNWFMNAAIILSLLLAGFFVYTPGISTVVHLSMPLRWEVLEVFCAVIPFAILLFVYDELRRLAVRTFHGGWIAQEFYA